MSKYFIPALDRFLTAVQRCWPCAGTKPVLSGLLAFVADRPFSVHRISYILHIKSDLTDDVFTVHLPY